MKVTSRCHQGVEGAEVAMLSIVDLLFVYLGTLMNEAGWLGYLSFAAAPCRSAQRNISTGNQLSQILQACLAGLEMFVRLVLAPTI
jgi:hypothetical protein